MAGKALGLAVCLSAIVAGTARAQAGDRYELSGRAVAVYDLVGAVRIERGMGSSVVVEVHRSGRDASQISVKSGTLDGIPTLRVIFPGDAIASDRIGRGSSTDVRVDDDGVFDRNSGRRVRIMSRDRARGNALEADADLVIRVPDGVRLDAHLAAGDMSADGTGAELSLNTSAGDLKVSNTRGRLDLNTASGNLTLTTVTGDVEANTASGDVDIDGVRGKTLRVDVASGDITARAVQADDVRLESASGNITMTESAAPELHAESASGNVRIGLGGAVNRVEISTASGNAEVALSADFGGEVEMASSSGSVDVDFPISITRQRRGYMRGTVGSGSARVSLSAASGDVRLRKR